MTRKRKRHTSEQIIKKHRKLSHQLVVLLECEQFVLASRFISTKLDVPSLAVFVEEGLGGGRGIKTSQLKITRNVKLEAERLSDSPISRELVGEFSIVSARAKL